MLVYEAHTPSLIIFFNMVPISSMLALGITLLSHMMAVEAGKAILTGCFASRKQTTTTL